MRARAAEYREQNRERLRQASRDYNRFTRTGWTDDAFTEQGLAQGWRCAVCGIQKLEGRGRGMDYLKADHCHGTMTKRKLLCHVCNAYIEPYIMRFMSDPDFRARWENYLRCGEQ